MGFIHKTLDEFDLEYPHFVINNLSKGCVNDKYTFNITGEIDDIDYDEDISLSKSLPKVIKINLENDLYVKCDIYNDQTNLTLDCKVVSNYRLNNKDIIFNSSNIEIDNKDIIIDWLIDYFKTASRILGLNINCGTEKPEEDNDDIIHNIIPTFIYNKIDDDDISTMKDIILIFMVI